MNAAVHCNDPWASNMQKSKHKQNKQNKTIKQTDNCHNQPTQLLSHESWAMTEHTKHPCFQLEFNRAIQLNPTQ